MLYMQECETDGLPWLSCVEIVCCYKPPAFCHGLALAQQAVIEIQVLGCSLEYIYMRRSWSKTKAEMERQSRDLSLCMNAECFTLNLGRGKLRKEMFKYLLRNV